MVEEGETEVWADFERETQDLIYKFMLPIAQALFYRCGYLHHSSIIIMWFATAIATSMRTWTMTTT